MIGAIEKRGAGSFSHALHGGELTMQHGSHLNRAIMCGLVSVILTCPTSGVLAVDGAFISDNFDCPGSDLLDAWEFVNPSGDNSTATRSGGALVINADTATAHAAFQAGNNAPAVLQAMANGNLVIEARFTSNFSANAEQTQGLVIQESQDRFLRFDVSRLGTDTILFASVVNVGGTSSPNRTEMNPPGLDLSEPVVLRVTRIDDNWVLEYKNGSDAGFTQFGAAFGHLFTVTRAGVLVQKSAGTAFSARIDYVAEVSPVADGGPDCNENGIPDGREIADGDALDCDGSAVLDACEAPDCNNNGVDDADDIASGFSEDCNVNGVPDDCDLAGETSSDANSNGVPDECEDCNNNGIPDELDVASGASADCNSNGVPDECDIAIGDSEDVNSNSVPDECEGCLGDADCDDGVWCNGQEVCQAGECVAGAPPCDGGTGETCNEESDRCEICTGGCAPVCMPTMAVMVLSLTTLRIGRRWRS
jgi:hypothetical protein